MSTELTVEVLRALNTLLQFARDTGISSRKLLTEYQAAQAEGRELTQADVDELRQQARDALHRLNKLLSSD